MCSSRVGENTTASSIYTATTSLGIEAHQQSLHQSLEDRWCVGQAEGHDPELVQTLWSHKMMDGPESLPVARCSGKVYIVTRMN